MNTPDFWYKKRHVLSMLLWPASLLYRAGVALRRQYYQHYHRPLLNQKRSSSSSPFSSSFPAPSSPFSSSLSCRSVPVIVVGNLTVGGTGKTPLVMSLVRWLQQQGYRPAVVSRGYGGQQSPEPQRVTEALSPEVVGDEALMLAQQLDCPVVVCPNRVAAFEYLCETTDCTVVVSDDGLQHYALSRQLEFVVVDGDRAWGNGFCLPAGPLREPLTRLKTVDGVIINTRAIPNLFNKSTSNSESTANRSTAATTTNLIHPSPEIRISVTDVEKKLKVIQQQLPSSCDSLPVFYAQRHITKITQGIHPGRVMSPQDFLNQPVHAVAAIGHPERFFLDLEALGIQIQTRRALSDHAALTKQDIEFHDSLPVLMTVKDAVKCQAFIDKRHYAVEMCLNPDPGWFSIIKKKLLTRL